MGYFWVYSIHLLYNEILISVGSMSTNILSFILVYMINKVHVVMSIQSSIDTLKLENDELSMTINSFYKIEKDIK